MSTARKIALITGASRGLGKNMALKVAEHGHDVILTYRNNQAEAEQLVRQIETLGAKARTLPFDVGALADIGEFASRIGALLRSHWQRERFDFLVNNAGIGIHASFADTTEEQFDQLLNIQFKGVFFLTQKMLPLMADGGRIINISSGLTRFSLPGFCAYAAMKGAVEVLTRYLAKELGPRGIAVNVVAPGAIETDFGNGVVRDNKQLNAQIASQTALGRVGLPEDIGGVVASLLSEENRWINAQRIEASGGMFV